MTTFNTKSSEPFDPIDQALELAAYYERRLIEAGCCGLFMAQMDRYWDHALELEARAERFGGENFEANFGIRRHT